MRLTRYTAFATLLGTMLMLPGSAPAAASKEMMDLQRDVASLGDQLKDLQKSTDARFADIQKQLQQLLDAATKTNSGVSSMSTGVTQTIQTELKAVRDQLKTVTDVSVKVENTSNDVTDLKAELQSLEKNVNKLQSGMSDILNQIKLIQAPPVAPPTADTGSGAPAPPPMASTLFSTAVADENSGKGKLALSEFDDFLRLYPNDPNAIKAKLGIAEVHYSQGELDEAVKGFDAVIEQYPEDIDVTPQAYYMKGMALYKQKKAASTAAAASTFRALIAKYPHSDDAAQARKQMNVMGLPIVAPKGRK